MILDNMVNDLPSLKNIIGSSIIVRVPWSILPGFPDDIRTDWNKVCLPLRFLPRTGDAEHINWTGIKMPYSNIVILSERNEPAFIHVKQYPEDQNGSFLIDVLTFASGEHGYGVQCFSFLVSADGHLVSPYIASEEESYRQAVTMKTQWEDEILSSLCFPHEKSISHHILTHRLSHDGKLGLIQDVKAYATIISAVAALFCCKNVECKKVTAPEAIQKKRERKGILPLYQYHVLHVKPLSSSSSGTVPIGEHDTAIHWVRGHFKRYTADNKLFGKYTGLYWWQPHLSGTAQRVVEKEYAL